MSVSICHLRAHDFSLINEHNMLKMMSKLFRIPAYLKNRFCSKTATIPCFETLLRTVIISIRTVMSRRAMPRYVICSKTTTTKSLPVLCILSFVEFLYKFLFVRDKYPKPFSFSTDSSHEFTHLSGFDVSICNGVEWSKDKTQAAESIKWRPQQVYGSNQFLLVQPQTVFSTHTQNHHAHA